MYPQKQNILQINETEFFKMSTYTKILSIHPSIVEIIKNMQKYWKSFSENTKDKIWLYFAVMIKLIEKYESQ